MAEALSSNKAKSRRALKRRLLLDTEDADVEEKSPPPSKLCE